MKKGLLPILFALILTTASKSSFAWGKTGHDIVGQIAYRLLDDSTRAIVQSYLGNLSFEEAANWMDDQRSNSYYNYMRSWHYINLEKGISYTPTEERNSLTVMHTAVMELRNHLTMKKKDVRRDILLIFHLVGDLHQPMHNGYGSDRGGNSVEITSPLVSGNLHSVWDTQILEYKNITADTCMVLYNSLDAATIKEYSKINELKWMYQSRAYLDAAYNFENNFLDKNYIDSNAEIIKKQLLIGGIRLASILKEVFK